MDIGWRHLRLGVEQTLHHGDGKCILSIQCWGELGGPGLISTYNSIRPIVAIKSTIKAYKDANGVWQLSN